jgi:hypothetical protein
VKKEIQAPEELEIPGLEDVGSMDRNLLLSVLVYGPIGTWKTRFAASFPGPIMIFDFDGRTASIIDLAKDKKISRLSLHEWVVEGEPQAFSTAMYWTRTFKQKLEAGETLPFKTLVYDSLTTCVERAVNMIKRNCGVPEDAPLPWSGGHWGDVYAAVESLVSKSVALAEYVNVVWTAHEEPLEDKLLGGIRIYPMIGGHKWRDRMPVRFKEIYHSGTEDGGNGKPSPYLETTSIGLIQARTSFNLPPRIYPDYGEIIRLIEEGWEEAPKIVENSGE